MAKTINLKTKKIEEVDKKKELMKPFETPAEPQKTSTPSAPPKNEPSGKLLTYTDSGGKGLSGFETPSGKTYLGASPEQVQSAADAYAQKKVPVQTMNEFQKENVDTGNLADKQLQELQAIDALKNNQQQPLSTYERNVQAGIAFEKSVQANLGIDNPNYPTPTTGLGGAINAAVGVVATTNIAGVSLSSLFNPASGNIKQLQGDISDNVAESTRIMRAAGSKGADIQQAINSIRLLEDSTRFKYNAAEASLRESPKDVREGLDLVDEMSRNLRVITENRQALERYALTGNQKEVLADTSGAAE